MGESGNAGGERVTVDAVGDGEAVKRPKTFRSTNSSYAGGETATRGGVLSAEFGN